MNRVLCLLSSMDAGGAETFLMKIYRKLDKSKYQMDFCINTFKKSFYEDEILSDGGKIYRIPSKSENARAFKQQLSTLIKEENYTHVLRITSNCAGFMDLKIAKKSGAKVCCARSSNSSDGGGVKTWLAHRAGRLLYQKYVDVKIAPSDLAGKYTFGNKAYKNGEVTILHNGLDLDVFKFNEDSRCDVRGEFGISQDAFVVGHVGRFDKQKNHEYLIDIFNEIKKRNHNAVLFLIGTGPLKETLENKINNLHLTDDVIFAGIRSDVSKCFSAMDVFAFPSLYEGMPNTVIEAQATGLPCVISDTITKEANVTDSVTYLSIAQRPEKWADYILSFAGKHHTETKQYLINNGYDINDVCESFIKTVWGETDFVKKEKNKLTNN